MILTIEEYNKAKNNEWIDDDHIIDQKEKSELMNNFKVTYQEGK